MTAMSMAHLRKSVFESAEGSATWGACFQDGDRVRIGLPTLKWRREPKNKGGKVTWGSVEIQGEDPGAAAMAAAALTVLRASYRHVEVLDAVQAGERLGLPQGTKLPQGFYVMSGAGKIAAGLFPMTPDGSSFNQEPNKAASAFEALCAKGGKLAGLVEPGAFCSDLRLDIPKLFADPRNFPRALMKETRSAKDLYEEFGFAARSRILGPDGHWGEDWGKGYPAFVDLGNAPMGELASAKNYEISFLKCMGLPIHNHRGYSLINNIRELLEASERVPERSDIFESLMSKWLEAKLTEGNLRDDQIVRAAGIDDEGGDAWSGTAGARRVEALREAAVEAGRASSIGSERQLVCNPNCTSYFNDGVRKMIGSLDFALVDGQHSSIDYAILASAVDVMERGGSELEWLGYGKQANESSPESLLAIFKSEIPKMALAKGMDAKRVEPAHMDALWSDFASFCRSVTTTVRVTEEANPEIQVQKVNESNNRRAQKVEAMSMLRRKDEIAMFVELVNEEALRRGDPTLLVQTKSLMSNPDYSGSTSSNVVEFEAVFPSMYAVSRSVDGSREATRPSNILFGEGAVGDKKIAEQLSRTFGVKPGSAKSKDAVKRTRALLDYVGKFKSRELKLAEASLTAFLGKKNGVESGAKQKQSDVGAVNNIARMTGRVDERSQFEKLGNASFNTEGFKDVAQQEAEAYREKWAGRFDHFAAYVKDSLRLLAVGGSEFEVSRETRCKIAYAIFERAMAIHAELAKAVDLSSVMSADLAENVMVGVARSANRKAFGMPGRECADEIAVAIGRIRQLSEAGFADSENNFNRAREVLHALMGSHTELSKTHKAALSRGEDGEDAPVFNLGAMSPMALGLLIDAMPCGELTQSLAEELACLSGPRESKKPTRTSAEPEQAKPEQGKSEKVSEARTGHQSDSALMGDKLGRRRKTEDKAWAWQLSNGGSKRGGK